jgi:hypothetical protein
MVELEQNVVAEPGDEQRRAGYEECARRLRADYSDDPVQAYGLIRTLCWH